MFFYFGKNVFPCDTLSVVEVRPIYLDNHATTPMDPRVHDAMARYMGPCCGNAASPHFFGEEANEGVERARAIIAETLGVPADAITITSGATESNNMALRGVDLPRSRSGIVTTAIEHSSVLETARELAGRGGDVRVVRVDSSGIVNPDDVVRAMTPNTGLVSVMHANNEIGTIQPVEEIARECRKRGILMHVDACQTFGKVPLRGELFDMISMSAHKMRGPKGVGAIYVRPGLTVRPVIYGGSQEKGMRPGTVNVPGVVGFGEATRLVREEWPQRAPYIRGLRNRMYNRLVDGLGEDTVILNGTGDQNRRLPHNLNVTMLGVCPQRMRPDLNRICATSGASACRSSDAGSHVLSAIGAPDNDSGCPIRIGIGNDTSLAEIDFVTDEMIRLVSKYRGQGCPIPMRRG